MTYKNQQHFYTPTTKFLKNNEEINPTYRKYKKKFLERKRERKTETKAHYYEKNTFDLVDPLKIVGITGSPLTILQELLLFLFCFVLLRTAIEEYYPVHSIHFRFITTPYLLKPVACGFLYSSPIVMDCCLY